MPDETTAPETTTTPIEDMSLAELEAATRPGADEPEAEAAPAEPSTETAPAETEPEAEPDVELAPEATDPVAAPAADSTEPASDVTAEPVADAAAEPVADPAADPAPEPAADATTEPAAEPEDDAQDHAELPVEPAAADGNTKGELTHPEGAPAVSQPTYEVPNPDAERPEDAPPIPGNEPGLDDETAAAVEAPAPTTAPSLTEPAAEADDKGEGEATGPTPTDTDAQAPVSGEATSDADKGAPVAAGPTVPALSPIQQIRADSPATEKPLVIEEQMNPADAAKLNPLSASVVDEAKPAHDAVPAEAQATMATQRLSADADTQTPLQQLPASAPQAGTIEDATGISSDTTSPKVAAHVTQGYDVGTAIDKANDPDAGPTDTLSPPTELPAKGDDQGADEGDVDSDAADNGDPDDVDAGDFGTDDDETTDENYASDEDSDEGDEGSDGVYGDVKAFYAPMMDFCGDGFDAVKEAAESAHSAAGQLRQVPATLLDLDHRNVMFRVQEILAELVVLTDKIFHRN